ncbi:hypothetical protein LSM04_008288 [Trypanosoma melophagium]|uniref:uncharacterized protein n=1 Tax=Trypanosoma melophagium TaxID=715481 RepID=UPI00351A535B|nr:hypothetical protein LSM04_008288 [Trypanosoma melophagium]
MQFASGVFMGNLSGARQQEGIYAFRKAKFNMTRHSIACQETHSYYFGGKKLADPSEATAVAVGAFTRP